MRKRLVRNKVDGKLAGVCAGLGDYFNLDPVIFRILFILAAIFGAAGVLVYIVCIIVMPKE